MSIACLGLLSSINAQGLNVESTNAQLGGTYSNISQSNDAIAGLGIPNATWVQGVGASTDPNIPNALTFSCNLNNPVSPTVDALILLPTGGGSNGDGSISAIAGDLSVSGDAILQNLTSATSLATDANGKIIAGGGPSPNNNYSGKTNAGVITSGQDDEDPQADYFTGPTDSSLISVDFTSRVCTVQLNFSGKFGSSKNIPNNNQINPDNLQDLDVVYSIVNIATSGQTPTDGEIPEPSNDLTYGVFTGAYYDINALQNNQSITLFWWFDSTANLIRIAINSNNGLVGSVNDSIIVNGTFSFIF